MQEIAQPCERPPFGRVAPERRDPASIRLFEMLGRESGHARRRNARQAASLQFIDEDDEGKEDIPGPLALPAVRDVAVVDDVRTAVAIDDDVPYPKVGVVEAGGLEHAQFVDHVANDPHPVELLARRDELAQPSPGNQLAHEPSEVVVERVREKPRNPREAGGRRLEKRDLARQLPSVALARLPGQREVLGHPVAAKEVSPAPLVEVADELVGLLRPRLEAQERAIEPQPSVARKEHRAPDAGQMRLDVRHLMHERKRDEEVARIVGLGRRPVQRLRAQCGFSQQDLDLVGDVAQEIHRGSEAALVAEMVQHVEGEHDVVFAGGQFRHRLFGAALDEADVEARLARPPVRGTGRCSPAHDRRRARAHRGPRATGRSSLVRIQGRAPAPADRALAERRDHLSTTASRSVDGRAAAASYPGCPYTGWYSSESAPISASRSRAATGQTFQYAALRAHVDDAPLRLGIVNLHQYAIVPPIQRHELRRPFIGRDTEREQESAGVEADRQQKLDIDGASRGGAGGWRAGSSCASWFRRGICRRAS